MMKKENKVETKSLVSEIEHMAATLAVAREQARELERAVQQMEERLIRARGTGDVTYQAEEARRYAQDQDIQEPPVREEKPVDLRGRVENALKRESLTVAQLSRTTGESVGPVSEMLKLMKQKDLVYNVGSAEYPLWTYRIGDQTSTSDLSRAVRRLISERPMTTRELVDATGARLSRVSGVMVALLRDKEHQILNMGHKRVARWFLVSDKAQVKLDQPARSGSRGKSNPF
jgi:hypothetical protein